MDIIERLQKLVGVYIGDADIDDELLDAKAEIERLREALRDLLQCPAIADGNHNEPAWYEPETAMAEKKARAALKKGE